MLGETEKEFFRARAALSERGGTKA